MLRVNVMHFWVCTCIKICDDRTWKKIVYIIRIFFKACVYTLRKKMF